jgi:hypothetical protein
VGTWGFNMPPSGDDSTAEGRNLYRNAEGDYTMKLSLVINCDTRKGFLDESTSIQDRGDGVLCGCRHSDLIVDSIKNKIKFFSGCELETIVVIDKHEEVPENIQIQLDEMVDKGLIAKLVIKEHDRKKHRWADHLYLDSLKLATYPYLAHFDQDVAAFSKYPCMGDVYDFALQGGYNFICQPTQIEDHGMLHASTRFFLCKRDLLDFDEIEKCLDSDKYRIKKYSSTHVPCLEHVLGVIYGKVFYPPAMNDVFMIFSFVKYYSGLLKKLNNMPYDQVHDFVFNQSGGLHGASDFIPKE